MSRNILITSCGAKVPLVRAFRQVAAQRGRQVFVSDIATTAAALFEADGRVELPAWGHADYAAALLSACRAFHIGLLVPTADGELSQLLPLAAALREAGVTVLLPSAEALALCQDKAAFVAFCRERGFPVPETYDVAADEATAFPAHFPVFVRPRTAQGARGACRVDSPGLLQALQGQQQEQELLVQEYIQDPEYSVDLLMDIHAGRALQAVARRRIEVLGGEAQVSRVEQLNALTAMTMRLGEAMGLVGHNVVQAFYSPERGVRFIEVNPRFGGASNLSIRAGLDSPGRLLDLVDGDDTAHAPRDIQYGLTLLRYAEDRFVSAEELQ